MTIKPVHVVLGVLGAGALYLLLRPKTASAASPQQGDASDLPVSDTSPEVLLTGAASLAEDPPSDVVAGFGWAAHPTVSSSYADATPPTPATTSSDFIKHFMLMHEGRKKKVYLDTAGNPIATIGIGHAIAQITRDTLGFWPKPNDPPLSLAQIDALYAANVKYFDDQIKKNITVPLNQNQYDALMDLLWNTGPSPITSSSLKTLLNGGDYEGAAKMIGSDQWAYKMGVKTPSQYLQKLRTFEADLFRTPLDTDVEVALNDFHLKGGNGKVKEWHVPKSASWGANWDYYDPNENVPPGP